MDGARRRSGPGLFWSLLLSLVRPIRAKHSATSWFGARLFRRSADASSSGTSSAFFLVCLLACLPPCLCLCVCLCSAVIYRCSNTSPRSPRLRLFGSTTSLGSAHQARASLLGWLGSVNSPSARCSARTAEPTRTSPRGSVPLGALPLRRSAPLVGAIGLTSSALHLSVSPATPVQGHSDSCMLRRSTVPMSSMSSARPLRGHSVVCVLLACLRVVVVPAITHRCSNHWCLAAPLLGGFVALSTSGARPVQPSTASAPDRSPIARLLGYFPLSRSSPRPPHLSRLDSPPLVLNPGAQSPMSVGALR